ncbi:fimbrial protein [Pantoea sp. SOD02]|uniref:fimbrial protein n=1 Tax=Pantoea sp. SOD02 TaxID=2970818 RepID=UPI00215702EA|nr:fimbrial protein [Pantoea sp. SOD02]UVC29321.1 type 1 fimbrial protein [Pantoea sp. SOD02]
MKLNKLAMALGFGLVMAAGAASAAVSDQGHGSVTIKGSIIDAPCSITPETIDQTVDLGQISNKQLQDSGKSSPKSFAIKLENCDLAAGDNTAQITFTGMASKGNPALIGMTGSAEGASIGLTNGAGELITMGQPTDIDLANGNNTLSFSAYLQGDGASATIVPGSFQSVVDFNLVYP